MIRLLSGLRLYAVAAVVVVAIVAGIVLAVGTTAARTRRAPQTQTQSLIVPPALTGVSRPQLVDVARRVSGEASARALTALTLANVPTDSHWLASWAAAPEAPSAQNPQSLTGFQNQTVREIVMVTSDGAAIRIHLSNAFGDRPLLIDDATVAPAGPFGQLAGRAAPVTFNGSPEIIVAPGTTVVTDPVVMKVSTLERLAISLYLPEPTGAITYHDDAEQYDYVGTGDETASASNDWVDGIGSSWFVITGVDTLSPGRYLGAVAAIGDSITSGFHSALNGFAAWPDDLARRLAASPGPALSVIDEGLGGNRLINPAPCCGAAAVTRFPADVLEQPGVRDVILLEGINDIGYSLDTTALTAPHTDVSAQQIIAAEQQIITAAHQAGLRIFGATLLPFKGARHWSPAGERKRDAVNHWILTSHAFDGVINFAAVMAEPGHPEMLNPRYDSGDHLHPNTRGYAAMADAISLAMLTANLPRYANPT